MLASPIVQTVLLVATVPLVLIPSIVLSVIYVQLVRNFLSHVNLVHITLLPARHHVQIVLQVTTVHQQLDGIQLLMIDLNALGDIFANPELPRPPNVLLVVTMINLEIPTPLVLRAMLANTVQLVHRIAAMSVPLVIGVLPDLAIITLQVMHVQLVLTQNEKEGHQIRTVASVR